MTTHRTLSEDNLNKDPFIQFDNWYREHVASGIAIPESVSLGTSPADGKVSLRTVLLKEYSDKGFVFYTNYDSKKGLQLSENKNVALLFYWPESGRQVRIEGVAEKLSPEISDAYFQTRPRGSQLSAWASNQSHAVPGRGYLEEKHEYYNKMFAGKKVDRPPYWGGFRIIPLWFEFWQNDERRLHDRLSYTKSKDSWIIERLSP